ncbi:MAG: hypothetical protein HQK89_05640 [Nitrospirae bacterium]|nr:hypothetical protein [Nitrospirota bacterium]
MTGHLVLLPYLNYDHNKFTKYKKGTGDAYWTTEAIKFGDTLIASLVHIDKGLKENSGTTPRPLWINASNFISKKEETVIIAIDAEKRKLNEINATIDKLQIELTDERTLKDLLFEQGKPLENAVIKALKLLGYKAENYNDGELELDQVIESPEGHRYIGECEGKDEQDINITKLRQLMESMNADFNRDEVKEKAFGILFGNPQRLMPPKDRKLDFTKKCKTGAIRDKIALVKTADLFTVAKYIAESNDQAFKEKCRKVIHDGLGDTVVFPGVPENNFME